MLLLLLLLLLQRLVEAQLRSLTQERQSGGTVRSPLGLPIRFPHDIIRHLLHALHEGVAA